MRSGCWPTDAATASCTSRSGSTVANKDVKGLWKDMPIFVNDLSALSWA